MESCPIFICMCRIVKCSISDILSCSPIRYLVDRHSKRILVCICKIDVALNFMTSIFQIDPIIPLHALPCIAHILQPQCKMSLFIHSTEQNEKTKKEERTKLQTAKKTKKKMFSFSLIERVILSAGAMLIFSVSL